MAASARSRSALPPPELNLPAEPMTRISIFMNVFDCHVNRAPVPGRIVKMAYTPGLFLNAELDKASDDNERNALAIETAYRHRRRRPDRRADRAAHRALRQGGRDHRHRRALRPDPLRLARRRLPADERRAAGRRGPDRDRRRDRAGRRRPTARSSSAASAASEPERRVSPGGAPDPRPGRDIRRGRGRAA